MALKHKIIDEITLVDYPSMSEQDWTQACDDLLASLPQLEQEIATSPLKGLDFVKLVEQRLIKISEVPQALSCLHDPHQTPFTTKLTQKVFPKLEEAETIFFQNNAIYEKVKNLKLPDLPHLQKWQKDMIKHFEDSGCGLSEQDKKALLDIKTQMSALSLQMQEKLVEASKEHILLSPKEVEGLPQDFLSLYPPKAHSPISKDIPPVLAHSFPLKTDVVEVLLSSSNPKTRQKVFDTFQNHRVSAPTQDIIKQMLDLRKKWALLFNKPNYAALRLEDNMAKTPQAVKDLLDNTWQHVLVKAQSEYDSMFSLAQQDGFETLRPCDIVYYKNKYQTKHFGKTLDEVVRPHFTFEKMEKLALQTAEKLFDVSFEYHKEAPAFHPSCRVYIVKDKQGVPLGALLTDYEKRVEKTQGAWMNNIIDQSLIFNKKPVVINVGSFYNNNAPNAKNAPLTFDDATTIFHELGHAMHGLLSQVEYPSQSGTRVARDFVELPSQFLENYLSHSQGLSQAGLSGEEIALINEVKTFGQGLDKGSYLLSAYMDIMLHTQDYDLSDKKALDNIRKSMLEELKAPSWLYPRHELPRFLHVFGHGYESQYYSYLWAEVMEADLFDMVSNNPFGEENKQKLKQLYSAGGKMDEVLLYEKIRGKAFSNDSFLVRIGAPPIKKAPKP